MPGTLITVDGPGGVGKSTAVARAVEIVADAGFPVHGTTQPSRTPLGDLARFGTDTYQGMTLACLCAADRHHQQATEVLPALREGTIVISDRHLASSLVLQGMDGLAFETVWQLNQGVYRPDLAVILNAEPDVIATRLHARGGHSRFERAEDGSDLESGLYHHAVVDLREHGWTVSTLDTTFIPAETIAHRLADLALTAHTTKTTESVPACP